MALGAAIGTFAFSINCIAIGWLGALNPINPVLAVRESGIKELAFNTKVNGPGQNNEAKYSKVCKMSGSVSDING